MTSNAQVKVVAFVAVKPRTNNKTLTLIALEPKEVNISHTITSVNVNLMQASVYHSQP